jgi:hypothetical protein
MSVAEAEAAAIQAAEKFKWHQQHLWAIALLTHRGTNTSHYTLEQIEKNKQNLMNANKAARRTARNLRKAKLKAHLQSNDPTPVLILNDPPWYNLVEEELVPSSPSRAKSQRKTRRRYRRHD